MFAPESASCFPFWDPAYNCCFGAQEGGRCNSSSGCRGLGQCISGTCQGNSGCSEACRLTLDENTYDCCKPESFFNGSCLSDNDCQGARFCSENGFCSGISGCHTKASGNRIIYDAECICTHIGEFCSYSHGIACANGCHVSTPSPGLTMCTLGTFAS